MRIFSLLNFLLWKILNWCIKHKFKRMKGLIYKPHQIIGAKYISIGCHTTIRNGLILSAWKSYAGKSFNPRITIGDNCFIGEHAHISAINSIIIGNGVLTGRYVYISDNSHGTGSISEVETKPAKRPLYSKGPVLIGDNVWIGERVCILAGVSIGEGAIIGANAVVTHSIPPYCIAAGVPAKVIRSMH